MNMNQKNKRWYLLTLMLLCLLTAAGCGNNGSQMVYVPETIASGIDMSQMNAATERDGFLYALNNRINETGAPETVIWKTELTGDSQEEISFSTEKSNETFIGLTLNDKANFQTISAVAEGEQSRYYFYEISPEGQILKETEITGIITENGGQSIMNRGIRADDNGTMYLLAGNDDGAGGNVLIALDSEGTASGVIKCTDMITDIFYTEDGNSYIAILNVTAETSGAALKKLDWASGSVGPAIPLSIPTGSLNVNFAPGGSTGVLLGNDYAIYECDVETGACTAVMTWLDADLYSGDIRYYGLTADQQYWMVDQNVLSGQNTGGAILLLKPTPADQISERQILTLGTTFANSALQRLIIDFNKTNTEYKVQLELYGNGEGEDAALQYNAALAGEAPPDIIQIGDNYDGLVRNGILNDITPYMEGDPDFKKEDYLENILDAYVRDGKVYGLTPAFYIIALMGSADVLPDADRWDMDEMLAFAGQYPDAQLLTNTNNELILEELFSANMDLFINQNTGECTFTNDEFIKILEFCSGYGADIVPMEPDSFMSGESLMMVRYISSISEQLRMPLLLFGTSAKLIGYPTPQGQGSGIKFTPIIAELGMHTNSEQKEGVWQFLKYALSDDFQEHITGGWEYGLPVKRSVLDTLFEEAVKEAETSEDPGQFLPPTAEEMGAIWAVLESADASMFQNYDSKMIDIIKEEAGGFFAGDKTAEEVATIIQNRVQVYLDEAR